MNSHKSLSTAALALLADPISILLPPHPVEDALPYVYLTDGAEDDEAIHHIIAEFTLNPKQAGAFHILVRQELGRAALLM
jgi:hypothetical protein